MKAGSIYALCMVIVFVSFWGFVVENLWLAVVKGYVDNRNMVFPFLIGYGLAILAIYLLFGTPENICLFGKNLYPGSRALAYGIYFLAVMVAVSVGEIILGTVVEKICHFYWWDYSKLPLHITRYTSIPTSIGFSALIVTFMSRVFIPIYQWFLSWNESLLAVVSIGLITILIADYLYSIAYMIMKKQMHRRWRINVEEAITMWKYRWKERLHYSFR